MDNTANTDIKVEVGFNQVIAYLMGFIGVGQFMIAGIMVVIIDSSLSRVVAIPCVIVGLLLIAISISQFSTKAITAFEHKLAFKLPLRPIIFIQFETIQTILVDKNKYTFKYVDDTKELKEHAVATTMLNKEDMQSLIEFLHTQTDLDISELQEAVN